MSNQRNLRNLWTKTKSGMNDMGLCEIAFNTGLIAAGAYPMGMGVSRMEKNNQSTIISNQSESPIGESIEHRTVYGTRLAVVREGLRDSQGRAVTQDVFAAMCGHSRFRQVQLEAPGEHEVLVSTAEKINSAINYFNCAAKLNP